MARFALGEAAVSLLTGQRANRFDNETVLLTKGRVNDATTR